MARCEERTRADQPAAAATSAGAGAAVRARGGSKLALGLMLGVALVWATSVVLILRPAVLGPHDAGKLFVAFPPGTTETAAFAAIVGAGGEPVRPVLGGWGWAAYGKKEGFVRRLEANGALIAFRNAPGGLALAGCFAFIDPNEPRLDPLARALDARLAR